MKGACDGQRSKSVCEQSEDLAGSATLPPLHPLSLRPLFVWTASMDAVVSGAASGLRVAQISPHSWVEGRGRWVGLV